MFELVSARPAHLSLPFKSRLRSCSGWAVYGQRPLMETRGQQDQDVDGRHCLVLNRVSPSASSRGKLGSQTPPQSLLRLKPPLSACLPDIAPRLRRPSAFGCLAPFCARLVLMAIVFLRSRLDVCQTSSPVGYAIV